MLMMFDFISKVITVNKNLGCYRQGDGGEVDADNMKSTEQRTTTWIDGVENDRAIR
jgi:hypothetical protein